MPTEDIKHPGTILLDRYLKPLGIEPSSLAESIGVPEYEVEELIEGRRSMGPDMAARLALFFKVHPKWWLTHQACYDAEHLAPMAKLQDSVEPYEGLSEILVTPQGVKFLSPNKPETPEKTKATFSESFLARLRNQVKWVENRPRNVSEIQLPDGNVALTGE